MKKIFASIIVVSLICLGAITTNAQNYTEDGYTYTIANGSATITKCETTAEGSVQIPSDFNGYTVTAIADYAFSGCSKITDITIPNTVSCIGIAPFYMCYRLEEIILEQGNNSYSVIDGVLFNKSCSTLISCPATKSGVYTIPDSVTSVEKYAFYACSALSEIVITNNVKEIKSNAFASCSSLNKIIIPDNVINIGDYAFDYCTNLSDITISNNITRIEEYAFYKCAITEIDIPDSVVYIGGQAFGQCSKLTSITIPTDIEQIENSTFYNCQSLKSVIFSGNIPDIDDEYYAFTGTPDDLVIYYNEGAKNSTTSSWLNKSWFSKEVEMIPLIPLTVNDIEIISNNSIKATISNPTGIDISSVLIAAVYEDSMMVEVKKVESVFTKKEEAKVTVVFDKEFNKKDDSLQVFIWKDFKSLRPMAVNKQIVVE